jgi:hypothetical protein
VARLALIPLAVCVSGAWIPAQSVPSSPPRWPEALRAADELTDDLARSRARVEVLYAAGDLPGALQESMNALRAHPRDAVLLRRAGQLALALRIVDVADSSARGLAAVLPDLAPDESTARWWRNESVGLSAEARELHARGQELDDAVRRARLVSAALLGSIAIAWIGFGRTR